MEPSFQFIHDTAFTSSLHSFVTNIVNLLFYVRYACPLCSAFFVIILPMSLFSGPIFCVTWVFITFTVRFHSPPFITPTFHCIYVLSPASSCISILLYVLCIVSFVYFPLCLRIIGMCDCVELECISLLKSMWLIHIIIRLSRHAVAKDETHFQLICASLPIFRGGTLSNSILVSATHWANGIMIYS